MPLERDSFFYGRMLRACQKCPVYLMCKTRAYKSHVAGAITKYVAAQVEPLALESFLNSLPCVKWVNRFTEHLSVKFKDHVVFGFDRRRHGCNGG